MKKWTDQEVEFMRLHYGKISNKEMAKELNRSAKSIASKACQLGIAKKTPPLNKQEKAWAFELHVNHGLNYQTIAEKFEVSKRVIGCAVRRERDARAYSA